MKVGEKVICVNSAKQIHTVEELNKDVPNWVEKDKKYTIRAITDYDFVQGLLLEEISNTPIYFKAVGKVLEPSFLISRFRKLQENEVEVEVEELEEVI